MLTISRKGLYVFRFLMWGGIAAFLIGAIFVGFLKSLGLCLFIGGVLQPQLAKPE